MAKNILIVATRKGRSVKLIIAALKKRKFNVSFLNYSSLTLKKIEHVCNEKWSFAILRDPRDVNLNFSVFQNDLLNCLKCKVLDENALKKHPYFEDKLFQYLFFKNKVHMPNTRILQKVSSKKLIKLKFPVIVKKRLGSKGRFSFLIKNKQEITKFLKKNDPSEFLLEDFENIKTDLRVVVLNNKIIASVARTPHIKKQTGFSRIGVKVESKIQISKKIKTDAIKISKSLNCDFCGIDFVIDHTNKHYFIECNLSPVFSSTEKKSNANIADKLAEFIKKKIR
ncbi:ATP-grasp domain-containing protein [Candidatus Woesearchaeota archaeon]|jgi:RimK family alpha-L-glutamate ligase|nr:ATP-grasp domain-containing protein [Candidatus Woesearchaeota archaeon]MBT3304784.1 ATP-grasp domain-containing protein [Candidatus Woesearchaeota archaeon]MBT4367880.1 ATP-grasp domain-containing protein [Candidatus Woesearchaeota archaeon]MBT4712368.1 ATP-grasp domain-containing protein [Candidatus Woesearchaeota archaeon]MBT6639280.1 ATP-grasp domain-containing protein [Candidatus Woesearchaeota archaeon]